jgi:hypothetical protein
MMLVTFNVLGSQMIYKMYVLCLEYLLGEIIETNIYYFAKTIIRIWLHWGTAVQVMTFSC